MVSTTTTKTRSTVAVSSSISSGNLTIPSVYQDAAYIAAGVRAEDESIPQIRRTLAVNLEAPIVLAQAVLPGMRAAQRGTIINVTSIVAQVGIGSFPQATYAASKGGLEAIAREWALNLIQ